MSKVAIQGNASGTGTFTIAAPNSNTDRTLTLPDEAGTVLTSASTVSGLTFDNDITITDGTATHTIGTDNFNNLTLYSDQSSGEYINYKGGIGHTFRVGDTSITDTSGSEAMRIDSSGNVLVGTTNTNPAGSNVEGISFGADGQIDASRNGGSLDLNRISTDGTIVTFRKDNTVVGSIGVVGGNNLYVHGDTIGIGIGDDNLYATNADGVINDNAIDLGDLVVRFDDIYATNGTIQTSDRNEKQDIEELSEAEQRVAVAAKALMRKFRWKSAVEEKGDDARIHFGIIAQDLQAAFEAEGLDAGRYAMFISSTWWEAEEIYTDDEGVEQTRTNTYETAEEAPEGATERTRLGVRYPELLAFIIGAL